MGGTGCQKTCFLDETAYPGTFTKGLLGGKGRQNLVHREGKTKDAFSPLGVETRSTGIPGQESRHIPAASLVPDSPTRVVTQSEALSYMYLSTVGSHQVTSLSLPSRGKYGR